MALPAGRGEERAPLEVIWMLSFAFLSTVRGSLRSQGSMLNETCSMLGFFSISLCELKSKHERQTSCVRPKQDRYALCVILREMRLDEF